LRLPELIGISILAIGPQQIQVDIRSIESGKNTSTATKSRAQSLLGPECDVTEWIRKIARVSDSGDSLVCLSAPIYIISIDRQSNRLAGNMAEGMRCQFVPIPEQGMNIFRTKLFPEVVFSFH
jgi:hypothetical protein